MTHTKRQMDEILKKYLALSVESISRPFSLCIMLICTYHTLIMDRAPTKRTNPLRVGATWREGHPTLPPESRIAAKKCHCVNSLSWYRLFFPRVMRRGEQTGNWLSLNVELTKAFTVWYLIKHWDCVFHTDHVHLFFVLIQSIGLCNVRNCLYRCHSLIEVSLITFNQLDYVPRITVAFFEKKLPYLI
jgi:hypothetical protein